MPPTAADTLTPKQARFVEEYLIDLNATQAALRAGYAPKGAAVEGARLLINAKVAGAITRAQTERSERTQITQDEVLKHFWAIARADPNELIEMRRACCRHCYGIGHGYQRTQGEMDRDRASWEVMTAKVQKADDPPADIKPFNESGGVGYDARREPHPECPECFGEGIAVPFARDSRRLSADARRLYAGVKVTKDGMEIKMHDQHAALVNVGRHLGMFVDRLETRNLTLEAYLHARSAKRRVG